MNKFWFKPKTYGYGVTPSTWEGWATVAAYILAVAASMSLLLSPERNVGTWILWVAVVAALTTAMVWVSANKTEGSWRWRWGNENSRKAS